MVISICDTSEAPIYQQIRDQIVLGISDGRLQPGEQLPTVRGLALEIGINAMTVQKAYQLLKQEGYITTAGRHGGARVREHFAGSRELPSESLKQLQRVISEARVRGISREEFFQLCDSYFERGEQG